ncbi:hypothetical protein SAMD00019534_042130 [Acytostelium subglobosum LB1]|uniref:hypothetical protein n=1 Tax=Acytostelium subglobosum LB1 TaxID=1410327 RepID=UPI000644FFF1|nr:hypothetical protein SAMD00019534_042130 [Acytostelium subglobosum LB1]GAM21038.1 hypothetical protein SAMD00019534_042130 [Acytostelium subglobosum LB1]|eukprot:XP_012756172.1 hypothetical protein SAMD00019534_042130 [Acytostelium subglobosum LB1]
MGTTTVPLILLLLFSLLVTFDNVQGSKGGGKDVSDLCDTIDCRYDMKCIVLNGYPKCVFVTSPNVTDSCATKLCPYDSVCVLVNGVGTCVPKSGGSSSTTGIPSPVCTPTTCPAGQHCVLVNLTPTCFGETPSSCLDMGCPNGTFCVVDKFEQQSCVRGSCSLKCPAGQQCIVIQEKIKCSPLNTNPSYDICQCAYKECAKGSHCVLVNGRATCIETKIAPVSKAIQDSCPPNYCTSGYRCVMVNGRAMCVSDANSCATTLCPDGTKCVVLAGVASCVDIRSCAATRCPDGKKCVMLNYQPTCVKVSQTDPCLSVRCPAGNICLNDNGAATCMLPRSKCDRVICPGNFHCIVLGDQATCIANASRDCTSKCLNGYVCQIIGGEQTCVPPPPATCNGKICPQSFHCVLANNVPTCVKDTPPRLPCQDRICPDAFFCLAVNGYPTCVRNQSINACDGQTCPQGMHCIEDNGTPKCIVTKGPPSPSPLDFCYCANHACPSGQHCVLVNYRPTCIVDTPPSNLCEDISSVSDCLQQSECTWQTLEGCCGDYKGVCVRNPGQCINDFSCLTEEATKRTYVSRSTCKPSMGWTTRPSQCSELGCEALGLTCVYARPVTCSNTECCNLMPMCSRGDTPVAPVRKVVDGSHPDVCQAVFEQHHVSPNSLDDNEDYAEMKLVVCNNGTAPITSFSFRLHSEVELLYFIGLDFIADNLYKLPNIVMPLAPGKCYEKDNNICHDIRGKEIYQLHGLVHDQQVHGYE